MAKNSKLKDDLTVQRPSVIAPLRQNHLRKKKTKFLQKPKVLVVGDSITHSANFAKVERETNSRIRSAKAYSTVRDSSSKWPHKNITEVSQVALMQTHEDDDYTHLVLGAPTVDITNLDTSKVTPEENIEIYKQNVFISCQNIISAAENAIRTQPNLEKVIILQHTQRFDDQKIDPIGLKQNLVEFANKTLNELITSTNTNKRIILGKHNIPLTDDCIDARYRDDLSGRYDGVHLYGNFGKEEFTNNFIQILKNVLPSISFSRSSFPTSHLNCPQVMYQQKQNHFLYNIPVRNRFNLLRN